MSDDGEDGRDIDDRDEKLELDHQYKTIDFEPSEFYMYEVLKFQFK